ncbi:ATP-binding cassette transporter [Clonorchis sinensis]|uniref:ATP-binding cassette transporter n=1 Tax=Clonorchis sinensis TaxID=79923 RepID=G7Y499_CLOSI|nr:ATP-binding cassette transporter [Clonorchis sinensis]
MDLYLPEASRQVGHSGHPLASGSSPGSVSSKLRKLKSATLLRAQIKAEEMEKELQLMKARNEVRLAELGLDSDDDSVVDVQVDTQVKVKDYLAGIGNSAPVCETPAAQPSYAVKPDLPRVDLEAFDGNPRCYWRFTQQFKYYIEDRVEDNGQRMLYLIHYCRGPAKEAVVECVMLPPEIAYARPGARKHWISDRTVALLASRRNIPAGPEHNPVGGIVGRQVELSVRADREVWWTQKAKEMEEAPKAGNARRLFQLIRATGPRKPTLGETIKGRNETNISNKEERPDRWAEYFERQLSLPLSGTHLEPTVEVEP